MPLNRYVYFQIEANFEFKMRKIGMISLRQRENRNLAIGDNALPLTQLQNWERIPVFWNAFIKKTVPVLLIFRSVYQS